MTTLKRYSELLNLHTFEDRFDYLKLNGSVGADTFGFDRYLNQKFYSSPEWKSIRRQVILRDNGCDLGINGLEICGRIYIHHMNPITVEDFKNDSMLILSPEYLISVSLDTHNAIHYGNKNYAANKLPIERRPGDTCPWKQLR